MKSDTKRIIGWLLVAVIIIGSFLSIMFAGAGGNTDNQPPDDNNSAQVSITPVSADEWIRGEKNAKVELVEYSDFQCPACKTREELINKLMEEFGTHIKLVYRHFPLKLNHKNAELAAKASEAAGMQGKFWEMHDQLFKAQESWAEQSNSQAEESFTTYAKDLGLDIEKFKDDLSSEKVDELVEEDYSSGLAAGINSTPTFYLDGKKITPNSYEEFRSLLREAIANAKKSA